MQIIAGKSLTSFLLLVLLTTPVFAQAVWKQYNGPFSGEVNSFASYGDTIYAGSRLTGVFKSNDGGTKWSAILPEITYVHSLHNTDTSLLIGTNKLYSFSRSEKTLIQLGQEVKGVIAFMQNLNGKLFVSTDFGIYKYEPSSNLLVLKVNGLTDHGQSLYWTRDLEVIDGVLFCNVIGSGIYKSVDEGENWEKLDVSTYPYGFQFLVKRDDSLFCGGDGNLLVSVDKGETWNDIKYDLPPAYLSIYKLEVAGTNIFISSYTGVYKLQEGNTHWSKINDKKFDALVYDGTRLLASDRGGVYRWNEGSQEFVLSNTGINTSRVNGIELFDQKIYSATESGVHFTATDGDNWSIVPELDGIYTKAIAKKDTTLFAGTSLGLYATSESISSWRICGNGIPEVAVWDIEVTDNKIFVATDNGLYVSQNDGNSWKLLPNSQSPHGQVLHVGVTDNQLICGNNAGLYKILPDSSDWEKVEFFQGKEIFSINMIDEEIYASSANSPIYRSLDYCETWSVVNIPVTTSVDMIKRGDNIYASDYNKILYSSDAGVNWDFWSETGIPEINLTCITEGDSAFYAGTYGKSIWRRPFLSITDISSDIYEIDDTVIYIVEENTTVDDFKSNVTLGYGASLEVKKDESTSGRMKETGIIEDGDEIKIIAEDGKNEKILKVGKKNLVTSIASTEANTLTIFPVPSNGILYINHPERIRSCFISDSRGKKILEPILQNNYIDVTTLPKGFYFLTIRNTSNKKQVFKFIKE